MKAEIKLLAYIPIFAGLGELRFVYENGAWMPDALVSHEDGSVSPLPACFVPDDNIRAALDVALQNLRKSLVSEALDGVWGS